MTRSSGHAFLRINRLIHLYLGVFTAPALLFFAFSGALQTFSLHETTRGSSYKPPAWAMTLAQIHKKQTPVIPARKQPSPGVPGGQGGRDPGPREEAASRAGLKLEKEAGHEVGSATSAQSSPPTVPSEAKHHPLPLKIFFLIVSISLSLSTLTGIYMSYKYTRNRKTVTAVLLLGMVIPIILVFV